MASTEQDEIDKTHDSVQDATAALPPTSTDIGADVLAAMDSAGAPSAAESSPTAAATATVEAPDTSLAGEFAPPPVTLSRNQSENTTSPEYQRLLAIEVPVIVLLGQRNMTVGEVMRLAVGAIVEFNKSADEELELLVNNKAVGRGTAVKVSENFGIKITTMGPVREIIRKLGAR